MVEVMACPGGCVGGGGQPYPNDMERRLKRSAGLYGLDKAMVPSARARTTPLSPPSTPSGSASPMATSAQGPAHHLRQPPPHQGARASAPRKDGNGKVDVALCIGTSCFTQGSYELLQTMMAEAEKPGLADRVNFRATFCMEDCAHGPSVSVNGTEVKGVTDAKAFLRKYVEPALSPR